MNAITSEEWRACAPGYEASSLGRIRSLGFTVRAKGGATAFRKGRVLAQMTKKNGYKVVSLIVDGKKSQALVHRLVCGAFCAGSGDTRHLDGDRAHNDVANLRWGTAQENSWDKEMHGTMVRGARHGMAKLTEADVRAIRASTEKSANLAVKYDVGRDYIRMIQCRKSWRHI